MAQKRTLFNRGFVSLLTTQFLGAANDNILKQSQVLADSGTRFEDEQQEWEEERSKALLKIQQLMVSVSCDMGLMTPTPDLYQRLYGNKTA